MEADLLRRPLQDESAPLTWNFRWHSVRQENAHTSIKRWPITFCYMNSGRHGPKQVVNSSLSASDEGESEHDPSPLKSARRLATRRVTDFVRRPSLHSFRQFSALGVFHEVYAGCSSPVRQESFQNPLWFRIGSILIIHRGYVVIVWIYWLPICIMVNDPSNNIIGSIHELSPLEVCGYCSWAHEDSPF